MNARFKREPHLGNGFAHAGKHDARRRNARSQRLVQFAAGYDIGARAQPCQRPQYREIAVGLYGISDQSIGRKGICKDAVMAFERRGRIDIDRRADVLRQRRKIDIFGAEPPCAIREMIHREMGPGGCDGSFWSRGEGFPSGSNSALFVPQPDMENASNAAINKRIITRVSPANTKPVRARG